MNRSLSRPVVRLGPILVKREHCQASRRYDHYALNNYEGIVNLTGNGREDCGCADDGLCGSNTLSPQRQRLGADSAKLSRGQAMTAKMEEISDWVMD